MTLRTIKAGAQPNDTELENDLRQTDWLVVRKLETGKDVPADIAEQRAQARHLI